MPTLARTALLVAIATGTLLAGSARADIYVWTDSAGITNVSNLPPPEGARTVNVTRAVPRDPAQEAAAREAARLAEIRALDDRVRQLEAEIEHARRMSAVTAAVAPQPQYVAPAPAAPVVVVVPAAAPAYAPPVPSCDASWGAPWGNCGLGFWPGYYPTGVVVVRDRHRHHHRPVHHGYSWPVSRFEGPPAHYLPPIAKPVPGRK